MRFVQVRVVAGEDVVGKCTRQPLIPAGSRQLVGPESDKGGRDPSHDRARFCRGPAIVKLVPHHALARGD